MKLIRWVLFLPIAILLAAIASGLINWFSHWIIVGFFHSFFPKWKIISDLMSALIWCYTGILTVVVWMMVGYRVAPKLNNFTHWSLLISLLIVSFGALLGSIIYKDNILSKHVPDGSINPRLGHIILNASTFLFSISFLFKKPKLKEDLNNY